VILSKNDAFIKSKMRKDKDTIPSKSAVKIWREFWPHLGFIWIYL